MTDRETGRSRGFGFVTMSTKEQADEVVAQLDGMVADKLLANIRNKGVFTGGRGSHDVR